MQMNGSAKVSAPRCSAITISLGNAVATTPGKYSTGDAYLDESAAAGDETLTVQTNEAGPKTFFGIAKTNSEWVTVVVGYGTSNEETIKVRRLDDEAVDNEVLDINPATPLTKDHAANERVLAKPAYAFMPGTVEVEFDGDPYAKDRDADGSIYKIALPYTFLGTVDYSTGAVTFDDTFGTAYTVDIKADVLTDNADALSAVADGAGAHKTFQQYAFSKNDVPSTAMVSNLGDATVGFFFEVSRNGGRSFTTPPGASSGSVGALCSKTVTGPGGQGQIVRFRAGSQSENSVIEGGSSLTDPEGRIIEARVVTVDTSTNLNHG